MRKNVCIIIGSLKGGGAERVVGYLSQALYDSFNVYIFIRDNTDITYAYKGTIVPFSEAYTSGKEITVDETLVILKKKYKIDVSISFLDALNIANIKSKDKDKVIISCRCSYTPWIARNSLLEQEIKKYYNHADAIVTCSEGVKYELEEVYGLDKSIIKTIYNFVDADRIRALSKEELSSDFLEKLDGNEYFINIGRLDYQKNQIKLVEDFSKFKKETGEGYKLVIIGDGELRESLEDRIRALSMEKDIILMSYCKNPFPYVASAKAFILASNYEGLPNVLLEAMVLEVPIISTDCLAGPRELVLGEKDYSKQLPDFLVCDRGLLLGKGNKGDYFENTDFEKALTWIACNEEMLDSIKSAEKSYIRDYCENSKTRQWLDLIEDVEKKASKKADFIDRENEILSNSECVYIFGAGKVGRIAYNTYSEKYDIKAFIVTKADSDNDSFCGLPVVSIDDVTVENATVIIAVGLKTKNEVYDLLLERKCKKVIAAY